MYVLYVLSFFFWPLCCLFFFDVRTLIAALVSSNSSYLRQGVPYRGYASCEQNYVNQHTWTSLNLYSHVDMSVLYLYLINAIQININTNSVHLYLQLFVGGFMPYLRYLCLLAYSGVQHILNCVFVLFVFVLCTLCCQFLWIVQFWFPLRYSLTFI